jgi:hypothetical protein
LWQALSDYLCVAKDDFGQGENGDEVIKELRFEQC